MINQGPTGEIFYQFSIQIELAYSTMKVGVDDLI